MTRETVIRAIEMSSGTRRLWKALRGSIRAPGALVAVVAAGACSPLPQATAARPAATSPPCDPAVLAIDAKLVRGRTSADVIREFADWLPADIPSFPISLTAGMKNTSEVISFMQRSYPVHLRDSGIGGTTTFALLLDPDGKMVQRRMILTSGQPLLDQAARKSIDIARFDPVLAPAGCRVMYLYQIPVQFSTQ